MLQRFWSWYERHLLFNLTVTAVLFLLQVVHLIWLALAVAVPRAFHLAPLWPAIPSLDLLITLIDYTEVPALLTTSLFYLRNLLRGERSRQAALYLALLNSQWLHIFWITDELVVVALTGSGEGTILPSWLAWIAILIDYAEVPVIIDLARRAWRAWRTQGLQAALTALRED